MTCRLSTPTFLGVRNRPNSNLEVAVACAGESTCKETLSLVASVSLGCLISVNSFCSPADWVKLRYIVCGSNFTFWPNNQTHQPLVWALHQFQLTAQCCDHIPHLHKFWVRACSSVTSLNRTVYIWSVCGVSEDQRTNTIKIEPHLQIISTIPHSTAHTPGKRI